MTHVNNKTDDAQMKGNRNGEQSTKSEQTEKLQCTVFFLYFWFEHVK